MPDPTSRPGTLRRLRWLATAAVLCAGLSQCEAPGDDAGGPSWPEPPADAPLAGLVDPFIGTANDGQTYPGATTPWGLASPSPHTTLTDPLSYLAGDISNAGYLDGAPLIHGFGQSHLSGVGCPDLGAPVLAPTMGVITPTPEGYGLAYSDEGAWAGSYRVTLTDALRGDIEVELTATPRVGLHRIWFPDRAGDANVLLDVGRSLSWRQARGEVRVVSSTEVEGAATVGLFCTESNQPTIFFVARFSQAAVARGTWKGAFVSEAAEAAEASGRAGAWLSFASAEGRPIVVAVALSLVSIDNARANLEAEVGDAAAVTSERFATLRDQAGRAWQKELARIEVSGGSDAERQRFYTALYHTMLQPQIVSDVGGEYRIGDQVAQLAADEGAHYSVFSLWDTYRSLHPLLALVYPERQQQMLDSLGRLTVGLGHPPMWELFGEEVQMMVGDPLAIVIADSVAKGFDVDLATLYPALRDAADDPVQRPGLASYLDRGYINMEEAGVWGPASTTLEFNLTDACLARLADVQGETDDASRFRARSGSWQTLFDPTTGLLRPRNADGSWYEPFDPDELEGSAFQPRAGGPGYVEGTARHYGFYVPHDIPGLVAQHGDATFITRLQALFDDDHFVMWNEPDIGFPYLFNYIPGEAWRTQQAVRAAMARFFLDGPTGLPGNDDTGTLSAWYVFSALGFYPDFPCEPRYALGSPLFEQVVIHLQPGYHAGERFVVSAAGNAPDQIFVQDAQLNGQALPGPFLQHADIVAGGELSLQLAASPPN